MGAVSTFGPMQKSRLGEHEFEALMRMLDNLVSLLPFPFQAAPLRLSPRTSQYKALGGHQNCQHHSYVDWQLDLEFVVILIVVEMAFATRCSGLWCHHPYRLLLREGVRRYGLVNEVVIQ